MSGDSRLPAPLHGRRVLVGMIHVGALPGAPRHQGDLEAIVAKAVAEARAFAEAGFHVVAPDLRGHGQAQLGIAREPGALAEAHDRGLAGGGAGGQIPDAEEDDVTGLGQDALARSIISPMREETVPLLAGVRVIC